MFTPSSQQIRLVEMCHTNRYHKRKNRLNSASCVYDTINDRALQQENLSCLDGVFLFTTGRICCMMGLSENRITTMTDRRTYGQFQILHPDRSDFRQRNRSAGRRSRRKIRQPRALGIRQGQRRQERPAVARGGFPHAGGHTVQRIRRRAAEPDLGARGGRRQGSGFLRRGYDHRRRRRKRDRHGEGDRPRGGKSRHAAVGAVDQEGSADKIAACRRGADHACRGKRDERFRSADQHRSRQKNGARRCQASSLPRA